MWCTGLTGVLGHVADPVACLGVQDGQHVLKFCTLLCDAGPPELCFDWYEPGAKVSVARMLAA